jgi:polyisoprenoid-binding protein YceI
MSGKWRRWILAGVGVAVVAFVGGPFVYFRVIQREAPARLDLPSATATPAADGSSSTGSSASGTTDGKWSVAGGSLVGYRVKEVAFGQSGEAVGRTSRVSGSIAVDGSTITEGTFTADMTTVTSDKTRRDGQFRGRIMDVSTYPKSTFKISEPIVLGSIPAEGVEVTQQVKGTLTLRGTTKPVVFEVKGRRSGSSVQVSGSIPIKFADWSIPNPSFGPVTTQDNGILEFAINFKRG